MKKKNPLTDQKEFYAKATDLDGNELDLAVTDEGTVQISSTQKIKALKTNALKVFCRNNELETLEAPNAISVGCNKNKLTKLRLDAAENVHCGENKLTELHAPKATHIRCFLNKLTKLHLEKAVEIECYGNENLFSLYAPNARKISGMNAILESTTNFVPVKEIEIELKNTFSRQDFDTYDISSLEVQVSLDLDKELVVDDMSFMVALQEVNFFSYEDEPDIDAFDIYLMRFNDEYGQHAKIIEQAPTLPMTIDTPTQFDFSIPIVSHPHKHQTLLDVIKQAPNPILEDEKELVLHITFYLNPDKPDEKYYFRMFAIPNPFYQGY